VDDIDLIAALRTAVCCHYSEFIVLRNEYLAIAEEGTQRVFDCLRTGRVEKDLA
jgi:hypothetical protein